MLDHIPEYIVRANHWGIKRYVSIPGDNNFVRVRQRSKPSVELLNLVDLSVVCEVPSVDEDVPVGDLERQLDVFHGRMCVTNADYPDLK